MPLTGGNAGGGLVQTAPGNEPIIPSNAGTLAAGTAGSIFPGNAVGTGAWGVNADFAKVVTALVVRNVIDNLREKAVFAQAGNQPLHAQHVPGTNQFVYTGFADLTDAVQLLEGVPPETEKMLFDTFAFGGIQVGKTTALTDLAEIFSPFDLYSKASDKLSWNAVNYVEKTLAALLLGAPLLAPSAGINGFAKGSIDIVTQMKRRDVPMFSDGTYHGFATPETLSKIMAETGELGWTDTKKYADPSDILNGEMGLFRGIRWQETNRVAPDGTTDKVIVTGPEAYVCGDWQTVEAYRVGRGGDHADPLAQRAIMGWKGYMGFSLVGFSGSPVIMGPTSNPKGLKAYTYNLIP